MSFEIVQMNGSEDTGEGPSFVFEPYKPQLPESSPCSVCPAACCRAGIIMALSRREARRLARAGTQLRELSEEEISLREDKIRRSNPDFSGIHAGYAGVITKRRLFMMESDCAFLNQDTRICEALYSKDRPSICHDFEAGSPSCAPLKDNMLQRMLEELPADLGQQATV